MRRGHSGISGWRNENQRHFRPRGGGVPHYGLPQPYPLLDLPPKFAGPRGPRFRRGNQHYNVHGAPPNSHYTYRNNQQSRQDRGDMDHDRFNYPPPPHLLRQNDPTDRVSPYKNMLNFCESRTKHNHRRINNMGDVDHRQNTSIVERFETARPHPVPPWANLVEDRTSFDERSPHNQYHDDVDGNQIPHFTGHRPPTSDHYGGDISAAIENSNSFSRSVDDTVDLVRKRLLNRNESQNNVDNPPMEHYPDDNPDAAAIASSYHNEPQTPPARKRIQRRGQNVKTNCDKIKNKIVHQLFKMDKKKIHKLMDDPSSSSKFEFAISSLITESQNSLDRHLRSVAEKSLCSSSAEFIRDDNNTIYEDTFLKQMQCILEPQDTVLLEDIKPLVMAELTKVLQLDEFDQRFDLVEEDPNYYSVEEQANNSNYAYENEYANFPKDHFVPHYPEPDNSYYQEEQFSRTHFSAQDTPESPPNEYKHDGPLFERRPAKMSCDSSELRQESAESREQARSAAKKSIDFNQLRRENAESREQATSAAKKSIDFNQLRRESAESREQATSAAKKSTDFNQLRQESTESREQATSAAKKSDSSQLRRESAESREQAKRSADRERKGISEESRKPESPFSVFDTNAEQLSEEEDPFADLDKQYHVAVDRNFIEAELDRHFMAANENSLSETGSVAKVQPINSDKDKSPIVKREVLFSPEINPNTIKSETNNELIKTEVETQILTIAELYNALPFKGPDYRYSPPVIKKRKSHLQNIPAKSGHLNLTGINNDASTKNQNQKINKNIINQEQNPELKNAHKASEISENSVKSTIPSNARKRSIDQKPSHRKEKRKKSEPTPVEPNKQICNKNIIINVNDCGSKSSEKKCEAGNSVFNLFFSKDETEKELPEENKNVEIGDKVYSDKYVKRKETPVKKEHEIKKEHESKRNRSSSTSHSIVSPEENSTSCSETQSKVDAKIKLKPIDMFSEHPKKNSSSHQAHRNTAQGHETPTKKETTTPNKVEEKSPPKGPKAKSSKRHVGTQILLKMHAKETQTSFPKSKLCETHGEIKTLTAKATQTNPVTIEKSGIKSTDAFERMKEIDLEIQVLLQEKFKLYNSLEAKESCSNTMNNLGMTVLNVTPIEENKEEELNEDALSADAIVDDFTSIPVEELEQIALETVQELPSDTVQELPSDTVQELPSGTVQEIPSDTLKVQKRSHRRKTSQGRDTTSAKSRSPSIISYKTDKKANAPNISLIEQIITDDRPLEDIISLDDLEMIEETKPTTTNKKKKSQRPQRTSKKKPPKRSKAVKPNNAPAPYIIRECSVVLTRVDVNKYRSISNVTKTEKPQQKKRLTDIVEKAVQNVTKGKKSSLRRKPVAGVVQETIRKETKVENPPPKKVVVAVLAKNHIIANADVTKVSNVVVEKAAVTKLPNVVVEKAEVTKVSDVVVEKAAVTKVPNVVEKAEVTKVSDVEQTVVSDNADLQLDMLDVSEDIVIGDCEIKSSEKDVAEREDVSISEDFILDNSQSSCDDAVPSEAAHNDNECRMFDYSSDETLRRDSVTVTGNADAVLAIECIENNFIAACLDGNVYHVSGDGYLLATLRGSNLAVTCLTIVKEKYGTTVYTGSLDSRIRYYDLDTGLEKGPECNVLSPIQTMDRAWDTVFVGTRTGFVLQFECKNNMLIPISTVKFSEQSILALRALKEGPRKVLLVAARSENVTIKDAQTGLLLRTLEGPKMTVYTLLFEEGKVYCGTSSHQIHVFDYSSGSHCGTHEGGKGCVCLRAAGGLLFAGCYDGCVYVYREGEGRPFAQLRGPGLMLLSLAVVGSKIIAGYKDRSLYIWKIPLSILKEMIL